VVSGGFTFWALLEKLWLHFDLTADLRNVNNITLNSVTWS